MNYFKYKCPYCKQLNQVPQYLFTNRELALGDKVIPKNGVVLPTTSFSISTYPRSCRNSPNCSRFSVVLIDEHQIIRGFFPDFIRGGIYANYYQAEKYLSPYQYVLANTGRDTVSAAQIDGLNNLVLRNLNLVDAKKHRKMTGR